MTKSEAIKVLEKYKRYAEGILTDEVLDSIAFDMAIEALQAEPSEQYKKGFEDAKRAFELEYARESENMRKRNAELEVMLNSYREISAEPCKSTDQNVAYVPIGDLISRQWLLDLYDIDTTSFKETAKVPLEVVIQNIKDAPTIEHSGDLISRDEAIAYIDRVTNSGLGKHKSLEYIRKYISALPSAETHEIRTETHECVKETHDNDLISRADAKREVYLLGKNLSINDIWDCLDALPSADVVSREDYHNLLMASNDIDRALREYQAKEEADADRPTLKQTDTMIIADALRYLIKDTERHELDRTRAEELREQILKYGASMCHSADRPQVNSNSAEEQIAETCDRPKGEWVFNAYINTEKSWFICSKCGSSVFHKSNYCPHCGADMRGDKDD